MEIDIDIEIEDNEDIFNRPGPQGNRKRIIKKKGGSNRAFLGVMMKNKNGVNAIEIVHGSAAEKAGLQNGDVIQSINNQEISSFQSLVNTLSDAKVNDVVDVTYTRNEQTITTKATLGERQESHHRVFKSKRRGCGIKERCKSKSNTVQLGVYIDDVENGVKVSEVIKGTAAEKANLKAGDVIYKIDKAGIENTNGLIKVIQSHASGDVVKVRFYRNGKKETVKTTLAKKVFKSNSCAQSCWDNCSNCSDACKKKCLDNKTTIIEEEEITLPPSGEDSNNSVIDEIVREEIDSPSLSLKVEEFSLFPNPSDGTIRVSFVLEKKEPIYINIVDVSGKIIYEEMIRDFDGNYQSQIDLSDNADGSYFFIVLQGEDTYSEQIILGRN